MSVLSLRNQLDGRESSDHMMDHHQHHHSSSNGHHHITSNNNNSMSDMHHAVHRDQMARERERENHHHHSSGVRASKYPRWTPVASPVDLTISDHNPSHHNNHSVGSPTGSAYSDMGPSSLSSLPPGYPHSVGSSSQRDDMNNVFNSRKQREFIPDNKKDDCYWDRRRRNNEAAKR